MKAFPGATEASLRVCTWRAQPLPALTGVLVPEDKLPPLNRSHDSSDAKPGETHFQSGFKLFGQSLAT